MTRDEMLRKLNTVKFEFIDPPSEWRDVGFTERPIWVNSKGYGYIMCDEPLLAWESEGIKKEVWDNLKNKIVNKMISINDIEDTPLLDMINTMYYGDFNFGEDDLAEALSPLLILIPEPTQGLFCVETMDGVKFYSTKTDFLEAYERDWCDYEWCDLSDDILKCWINRLFNEDKLY